MAKAKKLEVKLTKSVIGEKPKNRATVRGLGLRRMQQVKVHNDTPAIRGMIHAVAHLVTVKEV